LIFYLFVAIALIFNAGLYHYALYKESKKIRNISAGLSLIIIAVIWFLSKSE